MGNYPASKQHLTVTQPDGRRLVSRPVRRRIEHEEANLAIAEGAQSAVITDQNDRLLYEAHRVDGAQFSWRNALMAGAAIIPLVDATLWHGERYSLEGYANLFGGRLEFVEEPA